jgi:hypothetical protein
MTYQLRIKENIRKENRKFVEDTKTREKNMKGCIIFVCLLERYKAKAVLEFHHPAHPPATPSRLKNVIIGDLVA